MVHENCRAGTRDFECSEIFLSLPHTILLHLSLLPSKLGRQSCHVACLLIYVSVRNKICKNDFPLVSSFLHEKYIFGQKEGPVHRGPVHSIKMLLYPLYDPVRNAFDAGNSITWVSGRGLGPGNRDFFVPCEMASSR